MIIYHCIVWSFIEILKIYYYSVWQSNLIPCLSVYCTHRFIEQKWKYLKILPCASLHMPLSASLHIPLSGSTLHPMTQAKLWPKPNCSPKPLPTSGITTLTLEADSLPSTKTPITKSKALSTDLSAYYPAYPIWHTLSPAALCGSNGKHPQANSPPTNESSRHWSPHSVCNTTLSPQKKNFSRQLPLMQNQRHCNSPEPPNKPTPAS